jgi:uncharacterized protein (DUF924 family)
MGDIAQPAQDLLNFWFSEENRPNWFAKSVAFDEELRRRFDRDVDAARLGAFDDWVEHPRSCLALILLLDQLPRNLFRDSPQAFASDDKAVAVTHDALARGYEKQLQDAEVAFLLMPLMHSESLHDQELSVQLFSQYGAPENADYARQHYEIIKLFGRFPHRNAVLARPNRPEETEFLKGFAGF